MKTITALEAKNSFGQFLDAAQRAPVVVTKNRRRVAALVAMHDLEAVAEHFLALPIKAAVAEGRLTLVDAIMEQVAINRDLAEAEAAIDAGKGTVIDEAYFARLAGRGLPRSRS